MNIFLYKTIKNIRYIKIVFWLTTIINIMMGVLSQEQWYSLFTVVNIISLISLGFGYYYKPLYLLGIYPILVLLYQKLLNKNYSNLFIEFGLYDILFIVYFLILILAVSLIRTIEKLNEKYIDTTTALVNALDSRDKYTKNHSENVANYSYAIAKKLKLQKEICNYIYIGGLLHDIGKIGIPEEILLKPGRLTGEEFDKIKEHPRIGYEMIKHIDFFRSSGILDILLYHHERFDGKGYPNGLSGTDIPLVARIVSVADSFDAMNSKRKYRDKMDLEVIIKEMERNKGTQFDPIIAETFLNILKYIKPEELLLNIKKSRD